MPGVGADSLSATLSIYLSLCVSVSVSLSLFTYTGDPHFRSFDQLRFGFQGVGTYLVFQTQELQVQVRINL